MSNFEMILDYAKTCSVLAVLIVVLTIIWAIQETIVSCFKWNVIGIRGYQGVEKITTYIPAADVESADDLTDMDEDELIDRVMQLKASNIKLQTQLDTLNGVANAKK